MPNQSRPSPSSAPGGHILQAFIQSINQAVHCSDQDCIARIAAQQLAWLLDARTGLILWPHPETGAASLRVAQIQPFQTEPDWTTAPGLPGVRALLDRALSTGPVQISRAQAGPDTRAVLDAAAAQALLIFPAPPYAIGAAFPAQPSLPADQLHLAAQLADLAASLGERNRLFAEMDQRSHVLEMIYQASLSLTSSLDLENVLNAILKSSAGLIKAALDAHIFLYDQDVLIFGAALRNGDISDTPIAPPRQHGLTYTVARSGQMVVVENLKTHALFKDAPADWHGAILGLPLKIGQRVVGVMTMALPVNYPISDVDLRVLRLLGDQAAIAIENARLHRIINQQAHTDVVTGLPNRRSFDERLVEEIRRSNRYDHPFGLVMLDLNNFKAVNDTFGHPTGDSLLRQVGVCLRRAIRDTDFIARYGGDEFAMIFPETDLSTAQMVTGRISADLAAFCPNLPALLSDYPLTAAQGIAIYPIHAATAVELVAKADQDLYEDKRRYK